MEGPFGEWPGYYAHGAANEPVIRVKKLYYRNNPILCGAPPLKPPFITFGVPIGAAAIWNYLEKADVPDIKGVWCYVGGSAAAGGAPFIVVSLKQRYHGHAQQAAIAALGSRAGNYHERADQQQKRRHDRHDQRERQNQSKGGITPAPQVRRADAEAAAGHGLIITLGDVAPLHSHHQ